MGGGAQEGAAGPERQVDLRLRPRALRPRPAQAARHSAAQRCVRASASGGVVCGGSVPTVADFARRAVRQGARAKASSNPCGSAIGLAYL